MNHKINWLHFLLSMGSVVINGSSMYLCDMSVGDITAFLAQWRHGPGTHYTKS